MFVYFMLIELDRLCRCGGFLAPCSYTPVLLTIRRHVTLEWRLIDPCQSSNGHGIFDFLEVLLPVSNHAEYAILDRDTHPFQG